MKLRILSKQDSFTHSFNKYLKAYYESTVLGNGGSTVYGPYRAYIIVGRETIGKIF